MPKKVDFSKYHRPPSLTETRVFTDPLQSDAEIEITIKAVPSYGTILKVEEIASRYILDYVEPREGEPVAAPPHVDGKPVQMSKRLCTAIATIQVMEDPPEGEPRYTMEELAGMSELFPNAFVQLVDWAGRMLNKASGSDKGKIPKGSAVPSDSI